MKKFLLVSLSVVLVTAAAIGGCTRRSAGSGQGDLLEIAQSRGLTPEDATRALKTFVAPGAHDEYMLFASGGHSGQVHVVGVPSMRLLKTIAVFTPEPWQGYGYGADWSEASLGGEANPNPGKPLRWGDSHHPALSETDGKYDGRWLYINDRAHGRIGMVDLGDFRAKQVLHVPNLQTSHGGIFATPDTKYVHISSKVPALKGWDATKGQRVTVEDHLERYADIYRGYSTFVRVDQTNGRMLLEESFQIELPPYTQDLADAGKGASYGWAFINSYNVEMATGGIQQGRPPLEVGASQLDFDYLHIINWLKAEEVVAAGKYTMLNGIRVIPLETAVAEGLIFLAPEPRSPHGVDIAPRGDYITVSGKLDPHATVYGFDRILQAIDSKNFEGTDRYGIPILSFDAVVAGKVELGAGPLHTQYDHEGNAYTSLYLESAVAKWTLGPPYHPADHVQDVYFGIHVGSGRGHVIQGNVIEPGERHGARPGHGISLWDVADSSLSRNRVAAARDGIYLSFTDGVAVTANEVQGCRYGVHSMNSRNATFVDNRLTANLLGAALMQSDKLVLRGNRIEQHREGSAAYGILLKDIGDLAAEDNYILANRVGLYAESVPTHLDGKAVFARNVIAGNEVGLALQSSAALTMTENRIAENLTDVRPLGRQLSAGMRWSVAGVGNSWGQYRGYDRDRDGVGDLPHRVEHAIDALMARNPLVQAFLYTPAHLALEAAARLFPLYRQQPVLVDEHPLMVGRRGAR